MINTFYIYTPLAPIGSLVVNHHSVVFRRGAVTVQVVYSGLKTKTHAKSGLNTQSFVNLFVFVLIKFQLYSRMSSLGCQTCQILVKRSEELTSLFSDGTYITFLEG